MRMYSQRLRIVKNNTESFLKKEKESLYYKDLKQYSQEQLKLTVFALNYSNKLGLKSVLKRWLTKIVFENKLTETIIKEDYIALLLTFQNSVTDIKMIWSIPTRKELVEFLEREFGSEKKIVPLRHMNIFFELDGWFIAMPLTKEASIFLGKDTVWCSAYTAAENYFNSYVSNNTILFYIIKTNGNPRRNPEDKISIGYVDGKIVYDSSETVDASNEEISEERFLRIFGKNSERIKYAMSNMVSKYKGKHPIQLKAEELAKNPNLFLKEVISLGFDEVAGIIRNAKISKPVYDIILERDDYGSFNIEDIVDELVEEHLINVSKYYSRKHYDIVYFLIYFLGHKLRRQTQIKILNLAKRLTWGNDREKRLVVIVNSFTENKYIEDDIAMAFLNDIEFRKYHETIKERLIGNASEFLLNELYDENDTSDYLFEALKRNKNIGKKLVNRIISRGTMRHICALASNESLEKYPDVYKRLMKFPSEIRYSVATVILESLPNIEIELLHDENREVQEMKASRLSKEGKKYFLSNKKLMNDDELCQIFLKNSTLNQKTLSGLMEDRRLLLYIAEFYRIELSLNWDSEKNIMFEYDEETHKKVEPILFQYLDEEVVEKISYNKDVSFWAKTNFIKYFSIYNKSYLDIYISSQDVYRNPNVIMDIANNLEKEEIMIFIESLKTKKNIADALLQDNGRAYDIIIERFPRMKKFLEEKYDLFVSN